MVNIKVTLQIDKQALILLYRYLPLCSNRLSEKLHVSKFRWGAESFHPFRSPQELFKKFRVKSPKRLLKKTKKQHRHFGKLTTISYNTYRHNNIV